MNIPILNDVDKRIIQGSFPNTKLTSIAYSEPQKFLEDESYFDGIKQMMRNNERVVGCMKFLSRLEDTGLTCRKEWTDNFFHRIINTMINTELWPDEVIDEAYNDASHLCPTVTKIDRILTNAILLIYIDYTKKKIMSQSNEKENSTHRELAHALLWILHLVQQNEKNSHCTLDVDIIDFSCNPLDIVFEWTKQIVQLLEPSRELEVRVKEYINWVSEYKYIVPLDDQGVADINQLYEKRLDISKKINDSTRHLIAIEEATKHDWELFLQFVYDISSIEESVIQSIIDPHSTASEKLQKIENYEEIIRAFKAGVVYIYDCPEDIKRIICSVEKRLEYSPLSMVKSVDGKEFSLNSELLPTVKKYEDYNYLLIKYHQFRLTEKRGQIAKDFLSLSLSIITRNLFQDEEFTFYDDMPLVEVIDSFYNVVFSFYSDNKEIINTLPFSELQEPSTNPDKDILEALSLYSFFFEYSADMDEQIHDYSSKLPEMFIRDELTDDEVIQYISDEIASKTESFRLDVEEHSEERFQRIKSEVKARQIVVSLDIIYLFCDAIRIILQTPNEFGINDIERQRIMQIHRHLLRIEGEVNYSVYSEMPWDKPNLMIVRQERGLDTKSLIEQEKHEEELRNTAFKAAFDNAVRQILDQVAIGSIDDVFNSKMMAREELSRLPNCRYKELSLELFDAVSCKICEELVKRDKFENNSFIDRRQLLLEELGVESKCLPPQAVDSLTTAEFLYHKYLTQDYATDGFDYSCISTLYYQSFEEAYNALIWRKYAEKLNNLTVFGKDFTRILYIKNRSDDMTIAIQPYFYTQFDQFKLFMDKTTKRFSNSCMYAPFVKIMRELTENRDLTEFREYFARKVGFSNGIEMKQDTKFMGKCAEFIAAIENCIDFRNNASHGGLRVGAEQCKKDKENVISNVESVRLESLGLIQQLLNLINWKKI